MTFEIDWSLEGQAIAVSQVARMTGVSETFIKELYRTKRVSDRTYAKLAKFLDNAAIVELVGILGYYVMISMTLNVFRMMPPEDSELPFEE